MTPRFGSQATRRLAWPLMEMQKSREDTDEERSVRVSIWTGYICMSGPPSTPSGDSGGCWS